MFIIDTKKDKVVFDPKGKKPSESEANVFHLSTLEDVKGLETSDLLAIHNAIARGEPEFGKAETARFSTRDAGEKRVWGLLIRVRALASEGEEEPEEAPKPKTKTKTDKPKKVKAVKTADGKKTWKDLIIKKAPKVFEPRKGSAQERALELISRENGVHIDQWIDEMNKIRKKGKWHYGNAWSGLVYLLHKLHGYGLERRNNRFYVHS